MSSQAKLPEMNSIWLDEDEGHEKIYGLQSQYCLDANEQEASIRLVNSDKPKLGGMKTIELKPLKSNTYTRHSNKSTENASNPESLKKRIKNLMLFNIFTSKEKKSIISNSSNKISSPYNFQHISHAGDKITNNNSKNSSISTMQRTTSEPVISRTLSCAFVTEFIPDFSLLSSEYSQDNRGSSQAITPRNPKSLTTSRSLSLNYTRPNHRHSLYAKLDNSIAINPSSQSPNLYDNIQLKNSSNKLFVRQLNNDISPTKQHKHKRSTTSNLDIVPLVEDRSVTHFDNFTLSETFQLSELISQSSRLDSNFHSSIPSTPGTTSLNNSDGIMCFN